MKNKKGKKLVVLGAMAALLTLIGVSGSQTYAKYVETTNVKSTSATVAKWGYVVDTNTDNLFGTNYLIEGDNASELEADKLASLTVSKTLTGTTVLANMTGNNVVAPGTEGYMTVKVTGQSEVDALLEFSYLASQITEIHLGDYYPLVWNYTVVDNAVTAHNETSASGKLVDVLGLLGAKDYHYSAGTALDFTLTLSWQWAFDTGSADKNAWDTQLAVLANGVDSVQYKVSAIEAAFASRSVSTSFNFNVNLTQVQEA